MAQPKICEFLPGTTCQHTSPFLSLPKTFRMKIYHLSGLPKFSCITFQGIQHKVPSDARYPSEESDDSLVSSNNDDEIPEPHAIDDMDNSGNSSQSDDSSQSDTSSDLTEAVAAHVYTSDSMKVAHSLLLTCRTFHDDVTEYMYSNYWFRLSGDPSQLLQLSPSAMSHLRHLVVAIHLASCEGFGAASDECCRPSGDQPCVKHCHHPTPLAKDDIGTGILLDHWLDVVDRLAASATPGQLDLTFICDVLDYRLAVKFATPLLTLPALKDCAIRLGATKDERITTLAKSIALRCMDKIDRSRLSSFRWADLPREIKLLVLEYTDLVTPMNEVNWSPSAKFHLIYSGMYGQRGAIYSDTYHPSLFLHDCSPGTDDGCFCSRYHSAYHVFCKCWSPPIALMLTSKEMLADSQEIFYKSNKFVALPDSPPGIPKRNSIGKRHPVSTFLRSFMPKGALPHLRHIEIVFPVFKAMPQLFFPESHPVHNDWLKTIRFINKKLRVPMLTIGLHMADATPDSEESVRREHLSLEEAELIEETYERIVEPFAEMEGLTRFFVYAAEPMRWSILRHAETTEELDDLGMITMGRVARLEKLVMGPEYSSCKAGKCRQPISQWYLISNGREPDDEWVQ
ncbi:hypothetical protein KVT40_003742 [Elsinoe batatas]|uniref:Uncharacterized protein n=1 Tax=Elsinoe batatas TaxID=2601811 RepID=A0A8K0PJK9_9PEZI|nr:hypothetical protein KVT40_003742 [Elsinoe batatas]